MNLSKKTTTAGETVSISYRHGEADFSDIVHVVRCKDCKWSDWYTSADGNRYCYCMETGNGGRTENDYCSYGERKEE